MHGYAFNTKHVENKFDCLTQNLKRFLGDSLKSLREK